jgi:hypothetical protein
MLKIVRHWKMKTVQLTMYSVGKMVMNTSEMIVFAVG